MDHFLSTLCAHQGELVDLYGDDPNGDEQEFKGFIAWCVSNEGRDTAEELLVGFAGDIANAVSLNDAYAPMEMTY